MEQVNPVLYIIVRNDLPSMNPGKAMAQASHASNAAVKEIRDPGFAYDQFYRDQLALWEKETDQGFGTVLVLAANKKQLTEIVGRFAEKKIPASLITDPTYPYIVDADVADLIPVEYDTFPRFQKGSKMIMHREEITCGYVFTNKNDPGDDSIKELELHP